MSFQQNLNILSVCIRVHPWPKKQTSKADRTPKKTSDLATDGHGYTRMRTAGFLALDREKIGTKLYGFVLAKRLLQGSGARVDRGRVLGGMPEDTFIKRWSRIRRIWGRLYC